MILLFAVSLLASLTFGILLTFLLYPTVRGGGAALALRLFAGAGLGLGLTSSLYFICLSAGLARFIPAIDLGVCLLLGIFGFVLFRRNAAGKEQPLPDRKKRSGFPILLAAIFSVELIASATSFVFAFLKEPHGRWDAWLIWNMHARFLFRGGDHWREAFASGLDWSQWDYPLLLPLSIVRSWNYMGGENSLIPALIAFIFTFLTLGLLVAALALLKGWTSGYLAAMVLMGSPLFIFMGASQFADIPFAFFLLATLVMFLVGMGRDNPTGPLILAGIAAGLCAWTKNEGLLFLAIAAGSLLLTAIFTGGWRPALRRIGPFLAGAVPILLMVLYFKTRLAPAGYLAPGFTLSEKLIDLSRYAEIARAFFITGISFTQGLIDARVGMHLNPGAVNILLLIGYLFLAGIRIDQRDWIGVIQSAAILCLMLIGYFFVYVLTPLDLGYHLATSLNRLFLQLWPGAIFLLFMAAGVPEEEKATEKGPETTPGPAKSDPVKGKKPRKIPEVK